MDDTDVDPSGGDSPMEGDNGSSNGTDENPTPIVVPVVVISPGPVSPPLGNNTCSCNLGIFDENFGSGAPLGQGATVTEGTQNIIVSSGNMETTIPSTGAVY